MDKNFVVLNGNGANVRSQMTTLNPYNIVRKMSFGEGFVVHEIYNVKGMSGLQVWGRVSDNAGGISQEYVCLSIGNKVYAKEEAVTSVASPEIVNVSSWQWEVDAFLRTKGYTGSRPK